jgi:VPDSG-CTERM motif
MHGSSKILLAVMAAAALSVARPASGNLIGNSSIASQAGEFAAQSSLFQMLLGSPNSGHFSRMLETMSDPTSAVTFTLPNMDRDLLRLNVIQIRLRGDLGDLLGPRPSSDNEWGRSPVGHSRNPVDISPVPSTPPGVSVPDGGSTVLLLGLALLGFAALRLRLSF